LEAVGSADVQTFEENSRAVRKEGREKEREAGRQAGMEGTEREGGGTKVGRKDDREEGRWREG
jgi:hypothetical protein